MSQKSLSNTAVITGILGQDGYHLTKLLLSKDYSVIGFIKHSSLDRINNFKKRFPSVELVSADLLDSDSIVSALRKYRPNEIYNLGGASSVSESYSSPMSNFKINGLGTIILVEAIKASGLQQNVRLFQASSSEMFGSTTKCPQTEETLFAPYSPYGVSKVFAHMSCARYREEEGMFISCGIMYNHESEYRDPKYVTRKISSGVAKIKAGQVNSIILGDISAERDWGYAGDYVEAMWKMLQVAEPSDFVIATGQSNSVNSFLVKILELAGLSSQIDEIVKFDDSLLRPNTGERLIGDNSRAQRILEWAPKTSFEEIARIMFEHDMRILTR